MKHIILTALFAAALAAMSFTSAQKTWELLGERKVDYGLDRDFKVLDSIDFPKIRQISMTDFHLIYFGEAMPERAE